MKRATVFAIAFAIAPATAAWAQVWSEDFNGGTFPPAGWTVVDYTGNGEWQLNTFFGDANWTGADGTCADVNSDYYGGFHDPYVNTALASPEFVVPPGATLEFDTNYQTYFGNDYADTEISIGGAGWIKLLSWHGEEDQQGTWHGSGVHVAVSIADHQGQTARIRFYHYDAWWEWYWQVDNVRVSSGYELGDLNCDGAVNAFDIDPFVLALTSAPDFDEYYAAYPDCDPMLADINGDGEVNGFDIDPFVELLTGG